ncbi:efflux RND transporter periplasmic adaptor subunit [Capnocytophaga stomatis]|uniref:Efflux RND transporter periplasmic adaptor subunit n=1 Tax=Capnocytophaga stomatis TaxID=1848904 RepID=A0ABW8QA20_9FLAO|nr:HlyD family efflux transporter periplasmic adaptor subunit [Capnocytophaga stomatis]GIJ92943.1 ABC transporter permease [Capnocytophaga stomatis]GIJ96344.1 ABC transporter permease [Capnocytophaga stomatis]
MEKHNNYHESRDSNMDKKLPPKTFIQKYKYHLISGFAFAVFLAYIFINILDGRKLRVDNDKIQIAEVTEAPFLDYVDTEGNVQPIMTIKINALEMGTVARIVAEEGTNIRKGDTILVLQNPELNRIIEEQESEWEKQRIIYQEKKIEMEQKSILLQQQTLQARYELNRLGKDFNLGEEEFKMGIKSKAQLEVQREEFNYKTKSTALQLESLKQDSASTKLRYELMNNDLQRARKQNQHIRNRMESLVVRAPIDGQLSFLNVTLGQRVGQSESVGEIKVIDNFKIKTRLSEYYIDRITSGLPASITYQGKKYPLRVSKVIPEVKDRQFEVDLVFTGEKPENVRIGKSFRLQIELGQPETALIIPRGDFFQTTGGQWLFKMNPSGDKATRVPVSIGRQNPSQYEIISGLQKGDRVIISGYGTFGEAETIQIEKK